jgi:hypothetical protein
MKFFLLTLFVATTSFADDSKLCDYQKNNKFESYSEKTVPWDARKSLLELTKKVSVEVEKDRASDCSKGALDLKKQMNNCVHQCALHGSSEYRYFASGVSSGMLPLNSKTQRCQELCRGYEQFARGFQDGLKAKGHSNDCTVGVSRGERENSKSDLKNIVREIAKEKPVTKQ